MVKHGTNKKRRAGRTGRTKLKNNNFTTWNPNPKISDPTVRKLWNVKMTPKQNLALMGLSMNVNGPDPNDVALPQPIHGAKKPNMIELFDVPESDDHNKKSRRLPLQKDEQEYIVQCLEKYGTDYSRMFRDTKLNVLQHTEEKLRKMGARFLLLERDQILVNRNDIPETVQELMGSSTTRHSNKDEVVDPSDE